MSTGHKNTRDLHVLNVFSLPSFKVTCSLFFKGCYKKEINYSKKKHQAHRTEGKPIVVGNICNER